MMKFRQLFGQAVFRDNQKGRAGDNQAYISW
jgi:hypothetical protein